MPPRRACDVCYKRKIQCLITNHGDPCDFCANQGHPCTFERVIQKDPSKRTTSETVRELSHRVQDLEHALHSARPTSRGLWSESSSASQPPPQPPGTGRRREASPDAAALSGRLNREPPTPLTHTTPSSAAAQPEPSYRLSRCQVCSNWYFKGVGILSPRGREWISTGAGQCVFLNRFDIFEKPLSNRPDLVSAPPPPSSRTLPSQHTCRYLSDAFFKSKTSVLLPLLDRSLVEDTISKAYGTRECDAVGQVSAEACIWAMMALVGRTKEARESVSIPGPYECSREARRLLSSLGGSVDLDSLQATLLLWAYQKMKGQCRDASATLASACRIVYDLGGHFLLSPPTLEPQHVPTSIEPARSHIRRLFWLCYCFDKDAAFRTGSPPLLNHEYCEVGDPKEWDTETDWYRQSRDVYLARIKENASRLLFSPQAFRCTEGEILAHIRELDDELEEWRLSIEPPFRPRLSVPADSPLPAATFDMAAGDRIHLMNLQLDYLFTMINIHTTVRRCGDFESNLPDDLHSVVHSSADLSLEASRSIFRFLDPVVDFWEEEAVWIVSHYAAMAAMPLFVNILIHPLGNPADSDLGILTSTGAIVRKIPTDRLPMEEIEHVQEIGEFVMELVRLGHSAAWKVKKGEREHDLDIIHP